MLKAYPCQLSNGIVGNSSKRPTQTKKVRNTHTPHIYVWFDKRLFIPPSLLLKELMEFGNELFIPSVKRNDAYMYECIAKNSVPPATSRVFNIEVQCESWHTNMPVPVPVPVWFSLFLLQFCCFEAIPSIQLNTKNIFQFLNNKVILDCVITGKPLDKLYWSKNGLNLNRNYKNYKIDRYDVSNPNNQNKIRFTLEIIVSTVLVRLISLKDLKKKA